MGGMATVYLAHDLRHDREVAIKVLRAELSHALGPERFLREIRYAARLQHPHILPLFDSGEADGFLYYVMPYVPGESLRHRLKREKLLPVTDAIRIAREVADGLDFAHQAGIVHRDIKPENILLTGGHAVIADFGIARAVGSAGGDTLTDVGLTLGTPHYMSPEQTTGESALDGRSDIYALGCVLYEMLTGDPPFGGPTAEQVIQQHILADPIPIETRRPSVPTLTTGILRRALAKQPADRFATAGEFAAELARILEGAEPSGARGTLQAARAPGNAARWRLPALLAGGAALLIVLVLILQRRPDPAGGAGAAEAASVAILTCTGANEADAFLSESITQEIISRLAQVQDLTVIAGSSVLPLARAGLTTTRIADTLGVRYVLECSVTRSPGRLRVFGQLMDARTGAVRWARPFEHTGSGVSTLEDQIAQEVVNALMTQGAALRPTGGASRTTVPEAHEALLLGNSLLHRRSADAIRSAIDAYRRAIALDPGFAPAYAALASAYGLTLTYGIHVGMSPYALFGGGLVLADHAVALDSTLADGYAARGYILTKASGPVDRITADFGQALRYRPNSADVHGWHAHHLARLGRYAESLAEAERAIALDPIAPGRRVGFALDAIAAGRYDLAAREVGVAAALEPELAGGWIQAGIILMGGDAERCLALRPPPAVALPCLHTLGRTGEARRLADSLERTWHGLAAPGERAGLARDLTTYHAWSGDIDRTIAWMERAFDAAPSAIDSRMLESKLFEKVRGDSRFRAARDRLISQEWARVEQEWRRMTRDEAVKGS